MSPALALEEVTTPKGTLALQRRFYPLTHRHGDAEVGPAALASGACVAILGLDASLRETLPRHALFLDTETTGLAGGTGTLPFLIGLAGFRDDALWMEQLFLRRPGEERPMLEHLRAHLEQASVLVTYNGKCFDWPLLRTRFVMNRLPPPTPRPHLDLLFASRRVFRDRVDTHRLVELERRVLGYHRQGDIPGAEVPERYFRFLRQGRASEIVPILEHNALDLVALAAILAHLVQTLRGAPRDPRDAVALAAVAYRAGALDEAQALATFAAHQGDRDSASAGHELLAFINRQQGRPAQAVAALLQAAEHAPAARRAHVHLELAKLYEHRLRDAATAQSHAIAAASAEAPAAHARRLQRLARKLSAQPPRLI